MNSTSSPIVCKGPTTIDDMIYNGGEISVMWYNEEVRDVRGTSANIVTDVVINFFLI